MMNKLVLGLIATLGLLAGPGLVPARASEADSYWQCKTSNPVGWCPTTSAAPLPVTIAGGGFAPAASSSGTIAVTAVSANLNVPGTGAQIYVANVGTKEAFVKFGTDNTVTATAGGALTELTGDMSVPSGLAVVFNMGTNTWIAAITAGADTTTLRVTRGTGQ